MFLPLCLADKQGHETVHWLVPVFHHQPLALQVSRGSGVAALLWKPSCSVFLPLNHIRFARPVVAPDFQPLQTFLWFCKHPFPILSPLLSQMPEWFLSPALNPMEFNYFFGKIISKNTSFVTLLPYMLKGLMVLPHRFSRELKRTRKFGLIFKILKSFNASLFPVVNDVTYFFIRILLR